eukprot:315589-Hanusia_phi.AAC.1
MFQTEPCHPELASRSGATEMSQLAESRESGEGLTGTVLPVTVRWPPGPADRVTAGQWPGML